MAATDWTFLGGGLDVATVARGVTAGVAAPPGGGDFVFGFHSLTNAAGSVALQATQDNFAPLVRGASIRGCVQRGPGGGATGFSPFFFLCAQGTEVTDRAYLLGLSDDDPHRIVLRKGQIATGIPGEGGPGVLLQSSESFRQGTWLHLRLDVIVNDNGDVVLRVLRSDLENHPVAGPPNWQPVPGMVLFIDDALSINSGSAPLTAGRAGFGFSSREVTRRAFFDHIELWRQL